MADRKRTGGEMGETEMGKEEKEREIEKAWGRDLGKGFAGEKNEEH